MTPRVGFAVVMIVALTRAASAQTPSVTDGPWAGWVQCVLSAHGGTYRDDQVHTWRITGPPRAFGNSTTRHWPGSWSVEGRGSRSADRWTITVPESFEFGGDIGIWEVPASNNIRIASVHSPLVAPGAVRVTGPSMGNYTLQEAAFPAIEAAKTQTVISGTRTREIPTGPGWRKPFEVLSRETCTWHLVRGDAAQPSAATPPNAASVLPPSGTAAAAPPPAATAGAPPATTPAAPSGATPAAPGATPAAPSATAAPPPAPSMATAPTMTTVFIPGLGTVPIGGTSGTGSAAPPPTTASAPPASPPASASSTPPPSSSTAPPPASGAAPPPATGSSGAADVYTIVVRKGSPLDVLYWPPNSTATYTVEAWNTGTGAANSVLKIESSGGLSNATVTCAASGGAQCPSNLTFSALHQGVEIPALPAGSNLRIGISAVVTGTPGTNVTLTSTITGDRITMDNSDKVTHLIAVPSSDSGVNIARTEAAPGGRATSPRMVPSDATRQLSASTCSLQGPAINPPDAHPHGVRLTWSHINGASYTVSRSDMGVVTPTPVTAAFFPSTPGFWHSAPMYHHITYEYVVEARYGGGCGVSTVKVVPPRPWVPNLRVTLDDPNNPIQATGRHWVRVSWAEQAERGDNYGFMVFGHGFPPEGADYAQGCGRTDTIVRCPYWIWQELVTAPPGTHTWLVAPYWQTENGRMIDLDSAARATLVVPPVP